MIAATRSAYRQRHLVVESIVLSSGAIFGGFSVGVLAADAGVDAGRSTFMSLTVFAGGAQLAALAVAASGGSAVMAVATGLLVNVRFLLLGMALASFVRPGRVPSAVAAHLVSDFAAVFALAQDEPTTARYAFWLSGWMVYVAFVGGTILGALTGSLIPDPRTLGIDAAFPAAFLALLAPSLRNKSVATTAMLAAFATIVAVPLTPTGVPILLAVAIALGGVVVLSRRVPQ